MASNLVASISSCNQFENLVEQFHSEEERNYYYKKALERMNKNLKKSTKWYENEEIVLGSIMLILYTWNFAAKETKDLERKDVEAILLEHRERIEKNFLEEDIFSVNLEIDSNFNQTLKKVYKDMKENFGQTGTSKKESI